MSVFKPIIFTASLLGCCPMLVLASEPSTRPVTTVVPVVAADVAPVTPDPDKTSTSGSTANPVTPDDGKTHRTDSTPTARGRNTQRAAAQAQKDLAETTAFLQVHSKNRYEFIEKLPADSEKKSKAMDLAVHIYLNLPNQKQDLELYNVVVNRIEVEDDIFGLVMQTPKGATDNPALRDKVKTLVDLGLQERQMRLERLQKIVADQQQKLKEDTANEAGLVDERLKTIQKEESSLLPPAGNNGGGSSRGHTSNPRQSAPTDDH